MLGRLNDFVVYGLMPKAKYVRSWLNKRDANFSTESNAEIHTAVLQNNMTVFKEVLSMLHVAFNLDSFLKVFEKIYTNIFDNQFLRMNRKLPKQQSDIFDMVTI